MKTNEVKIGYIAKRLEDNKLFKIVEKKPFNKYIIQSVEGKYIDQYKLIADENYLKDKNYWELYIGIPLEEDEREPFLLELILESIKGKTFVYEINGKIEQSTIKKLIKNKDTDYIILLNDNEDISFTYNELLSLYNGQKINNKEGEGVYFIREFYLSQPKEQSQALTERAQEERDLQKVGLWLKEQSQALFDCIIKDKIIKSELNVWSTEDDNPIGQPITIGVKGDNKIGFRWFIISKNNPEIRKEAIKE